MMSTVHVAAHTTATTTTMSRGRQHHSNFRQWKPGVPPQHCCISFTTFLLLAAAIVDILIRHSTTSQHLIIKQHTFWFLFHCPVAHSSPTYSSMAVMDLLFLHTITITIPSIAIAIALPYKLLLSPTLLFSTIIIIRLRIFITAVVIIVINFIFFMFRRVVTALTTTTTAPTIAALSVLCFHSRSSRCTCCRCCYNIVIINFMCISSPSSTCNCGTRVTSITTWPLSSSTVAVVFVIILVHGLIDAARFST